MSKFDAQNTDRENAKAPPKSVARDEALRSSSAGSLQSIARSDKRTPPSGGEAVYARIK